MVLKELEIQGFKSFPDKTKITIGRGITAVVGPNGSGKSNISDAIRWVLGETSSRQLRGGGKMEDVIFGGTQKRSAMGYASVSLTVDNSDRRIDVDRDEVVIGRKYYRSGESEYTINGQSVRLKDIYELFLDTGMGRDGYSIIGQGRIAEVVGAKSAERREMFEEASGIAKYRYRKNEAERRLAGAEDNLVRLRDILGELEGRVGPLKRESEKVQKFLEYAASRKQLEVTLWTDTVHTARENLRAQQRKLDAAQADYERQNAQLEQLDAETADVRAAAQKLTVEIERANSDIRAVTEEIAAADSRVAVLENDLSHNQQAEKDARAELDRGSAGRKQLEEEMEGYRQKIAQAEAQAQQLQTAIQADTRLLERLQAENLQAGERKGEIGARLAAIAEQQTSLAVDAASAESAHAAAQERMQTLQRQAAEAAAQLEQLEAEKKENDEYLRTLTQQMSQLENIQSGLQLKLDKRRRQLDETDAAEQELGRKLDASRSRLHLLRELERSMDGYSGSVKSVMRAAQGRRLRGVIGPVSSLIRVKPGYETAIEIALGAAAQNIVVENEAAAKAAIAFLRQEKAGRATFLPLDTIRAQTMDASRLYGSARVAATLVQADEKYSRIVQNLLGRIVVVDDLNEASGVARSLDYRNRIVTVDGQVINAGGSYTGGSLSRSAGIFTRRQEIEELKGRIAQLETRQQQAQQNTDKVKAEVDALTAQLNAASSEGITVGGDKIRAEMENRRLETAMEQYRTAEKQKAAEEAQLVAQMESGRQAAEKARAQSAGLQTEADGLEQELALLTGGDDEFLRRRDELTERLAQSRLASLAAEKDAQAHRQAIDQLSQRSGESQRRADQLRENIETLRRRSQECRDQIADTRRRKEECQQEIQRLEEQIRQFTAQRMEKEGEVTEQTRRSRQITEQRESLSREISRLDERKKALETEYDQTIARLWEEYELTLSDAEALCVPFESTAELRSQVAEVRAKIRALGNVNVAAIDEYAEVSERYEFLLAQVKDVEASKAQLNKLIAELCQEMENLFTDSFARINQNFGRIFAELFGGGSARLTLTDPQDVLSSGIEIQVSPPGKIIKNLSALSGGEQSLVAISIYFAIFAVNPAPFCILDEIEAALDDVNVVRFAQYLRRIADSTQFIVITHRRGTMEAADVLYGVTMQEDGVSRLLRLELDKVDASLVS